MSETCYKNLPLNKIKPYRLLIIDRAIDHFQRNYQITSLPIDCVQLVLKINGECSSHIKIKSTTDLPKGVLARTHYIREADLYLVSVNRDQLYDLSNDRAKYPFIYSSDRMLNFTLAHEFGHIFLGHAEIPDRDKTDEIKEEEELEANEFAGRLLMPEKVLYSLNYYSMESAAEYFIVSKTALRYRLTKTGRIRMIKSKKIPSCRMCGNTFFSSFSEYCGICGESICNGLNGIRRVKYPEEIPVDQYKRAITCPLCQKPLDREINDRCSLCGTYIFNFCMSYFSNDVHSCTHANPGNARFCEMCGRPTYFYEKGWLKPYHPLL